MTKKGSKRRRTHEGGADYDALGELISRHAVSLGSVLIVAAVGALVGAGLLVFALTREKISVLFLVIGAGVILLAGALLVTSVFNIGRRLELRKKGIRFVDPYYDVEFFWEEIADIKVNRLDQTDYGVATVWKRGGHYMTPSGPLTQTEMDVTIQAHDGRAIHLNSSFLKIVSDPRKLISQIRLRAGLRQ
jgi:hypothetical protein